MVKPAIVKQDVRAAFCGTKLFHDVRTAIAVGVTQSEDVATAKLDVDVAVGRDGYAPQTVGRVVSISADDKIVGNDNGAKARGKTSFGT